MSHYLSHVFLAYAQQGDRLRNKRVVLKQLQQLELECSKMQKYGDTPKLQATMERIKQLKAKL